MTWEEWVGSKYNTNNFIIKPNDTISDGSVRKVWDNVISGFVSKQYEIVPDRAYILDD